MTEETGTSAAAGQGSLYVRLGGNAGLTRILDLHYERMLADDYLREYFLDVDIDRLKAAQAAFLGRAFGDPAVAYAGAPLHVAHKGQLVTEQAFDLFIDGFIGAAADLGTDGAAQEAIRGVLRSMRASVLLEFKPNPAYNYPTTPR
jgi:hemoglobin